MALRAEQLIDRLQLQPHPEGGYYREIYRSNLSVHSDAVGRLRAAITDIYFLLPAGEVSHWHRVAHDELWNFYAGAPLRLLQLSSNLQKLNDYELAADCAHFKQLIPADCWQAAESRGEFSLVGCTVAPGFDLADFRLLKDLPEVSAQVYAMYPDLARFIR